MLCADVDENVKACLEEGETGCRRVECEGGVLDTGAEGVESVQ